MTEDKTPYIWSGRVDDEENPEDAVRLHQMVKRSDTMQNGIAIIGFCSDEGVQRNKGRMGAANAPDLIRDALSNLPWDSHSAVFDAGNVFCEAGNLEAAHQALASQVTACLQQNSFPFVLGGGHEVAYGSWQGLIYYLESANEPVDLPRVGIINFDAHFDLRLDSHGCSSGTPFYQIARDCEQKGYPFHYCCLGVSELSNTAALFKRADALGVSYLKDSEMAITALPAIQAKLAQFIDEVDILYLTIDLDVLPAGEAPGVSAPAARGVSLEVLELLIEQIKTSDKLTLADIAEYNPLFDIDGRTARVAARLFFNITKKES